MDPLTHASIGAVVAQATRQRRLGRTALLAAAIVSMLPDLDVIIGYIWGPWAMLVHHRGFTHSLWFPPLAGPLLAYGFWRWRRRSHPHEGYLEWAGLFTFVLLLHPLNDLATSYGTKLLAPFSNHSFAIHAIGVIDFTFTGILLFSLMLGLILRRQAWREGVAWVALTLAGAYLVQGMANSEKAVAIAKAHLPQDRVSFTRIDAYPQLFHLPLRRVVVHFPDQVCVTKVDVRTARMDQWACQPTRFGRDLDNLLATREGAIFYAFTTGNILFTRREDWGKLLDLRYPASPEPFESLWAAGARFDDQDQVIGPVQYLRSARKLDWQGIQTVWREAWRAP
ncbi:MAG: metal-dependent hydrolase [Holosporales bacterium]